jgi:putative heme-binding domain-containing protein
LADNAFLRQKDAGELLVELAAVVGAQPASAPALALLRDVFAGQIHPSLQVAILKGLGQGLTRRGASMSAILALKEADGGLRESAAASFKRASAVADADERPHADRVLAIGLLAFAPYAQASPALAALLSPQTPPDLQSAAVAALATQEDPAVGRLLLAGWRTFGPATRREVIDAVTRRHSRVSDLFRAIEERRVSPGEIERDVKQILINHVKIVAGYRASLSKTSSPELGRAIYERRCASCHRFGKSGHAVGPDLVSVQNKSPADLLVAILDPSREAQPNFIAYNVVTSQGAVYSGIVAAESAAGVTLRRAEGKEDYILRSQIEEMTSTGKSLMPEGLEKDISPDQMADLIAFIKSPSAAPSH